MCIDPCEYCCRTRVIIGAMVFIFVPALIVSAIYTKRNHDLYERSNRYGFVVNATCEPECADLECWWRCDPALVSYTCRNQTWYLETVIDRAEDEPGPGYPVLLEINQITCSATDYGHYRTLYMLTLMAVMFSAFCILNASCLMLGCYCWRRMNTEKRERKPLLG